MAEIVRYTDAEALARAAAQQVVLLAQQAISTRGHFSIVLSGGSTPRMLYEALARLPFRDQIDWQNTHVFWGDERCVPPDHADSNYHMAHKALLTHVPVDTKQIHRLRGEDAPDLAASTYETALKRFFAPQSPQFDLILLGLGDDGHTASLFPGTTALHEETRWVAANYVPKLAAWRLTLTPHVINQAAAIVFLVVGEGKADILREVVHGPYQPELYPAQRIEPETGRLIWMVDEAAASLL